ncbi:MAG: hypothetical protein ABIP89_10370 [Polyangiaceae bacterium]
MSPKDRIARLEALLERVRGRKLDPRELARALEAPPAELDALLAQEIDAQADAVSALHSRELASESETELATAEELDPDDLTLDEPDIEPGWSIPVARAEFPHPATNGVTADAAPAIPADFLSEPMLLVGDDATSLDDYEVAETVELDGDGEDDAIHRSKAPPAATTPSTPPPPEEDLLESRQRLVSALPAEFDDEDDESEPRSIPLVQRRPSQIPADFIDEPSALEGASAKDPEQLGELELIPDLGEEPPPSSRRPIAQQLSDLDDFEADLAPPPVSTPPESGRQVTVAQDAHSFEEDFTSVRDDARAEEFVGGAMPMLEAPPMDDMSIALEPVAPAAVAEEDAMEMVLPTANAPGEFARSLDGQIPPSAERRSFPPAEHTQPGLAPEIVSPDLVATARVAVHEGAPPAFSAGTFGDLLDAALSL